VSAVTEAAVLKRVNNKLAHSGERLSFGPNPWTSTEKCYRVHDAHGGHVIGTVDDLESYARDLGVLHKSEEIEAASASDLAKDKEDELPMLTSFAGFIRRLLTEAPVETWHALRGGEDGTLATTMALVACALGVVANGDERDVFDRRVRAHPAPSVRRFSSHERRNAARWIFRQVKEWHASQF
jgi:hypothetical protein